MRSGDSVSHGTSLLAQELSDSPGEQKRGGVTHTGTVSPKPDKHNPDTLDDSVDSQTDQYLPESAEARLVDLIRSVHVVGGKGKAAVRVEFDAQTVPPLELVKQLVEEFPRILGRIPKNTPTYLLSRLDNQKLSPLNHAFVQQVNGIDKHLFIEIVESAIEIESGDRLDVVFGLDELFEDIDINGDGQMEWSEFTQYIIDAVEDDRVGQPGSLVEITFR